MMKEVIVAIIGSIKDILTLLNLRLILIIVFFVATFAYSLLLFPQSMLDFYSIGSLITNNRDKIGATAYLASFTFVFGLLYQSAVWIHNKKSKKVKGDQEKLQTQSIFDDLSLKELLFLLQFIMNQTTLIIFNETDPTVALLCEKGMIYPTRSRVHFGYAPSYNCISVTGRPFKIWPTIYDHLTKHPEIFDKLLMYKPQSRPLFKRLLFLDSVEENSAIETLQKQVSGLVDFAKTLKMGPLYARQIEELLCQPDDAHLVQSDSSMSEREYLLAKDKFAQAYREQLQKVREQVHLLAIELLRYQPWQGTG
ncbi:MAG: hypothetical protein GY845_02480 [Planctomycetes bacterium]|nr:hypothetical protein [Planctomycetota bacterium]